MNDMPWRTLRAAAKAGMARKVELTLEGAEHLPERGPVVIAARHYHHLYDGAAFLASVPRPLHIVVTVDWANAGIGRKGLEAACRAARWPAVVRPDQSSALDPAARRGILRRSAVDAVRLLREGRVLLVFPEGYPTIDPNPTPKQSDDEILPFRDGFARFARMAERSGVPSVPIVPAGLRYERGPRWRLTIRYGPAVTVSDDIQAIRDRVEAQVRLLSG
ncbi:MAG: 1-acyl-sn-glycerol-3-phosphate acyltransferase [Thermomicrobiales bacterium]|nr:1-acyl-sn-glycerol-3-phosphate acyltransferase [Thermomicrobiales bacterium]